MNYVITSCCQQIYTTKLYLHFHLLSGWDEMHGCYNRLAFGGCIRTNDDGKSEHSCPKGFIGRAADSTLTLACGSKT